MVSCSGYSPAQAVYRCERPNQMLGLPRCFTFGGRRVDAAVTRELLRVVEGDQLFAVGGSRKVRLLAEHCQTSNRRSSQLLFWAYHSFQTLRPPLALVQYRTHKHKP